MPLSRQSSAFILMLGALSALPPLATDMGLPALPDIADSLSTSLSNAGLTLSVFLLGFALAPVAFSPLSDRFGRRPLLLAGLSVYGLAGIACSLAPTIALVLGGRLLQGMGAGMAAAMPLAIIRDSFSGNDARTRLSYVTLVLSIAPLIAPSIGSALLALTGWRGIYGLLGAAGVALFAVIWFGFAETRAANENSGITPGELVSTYGDLLSHRSFVGFVLLNAFSFAGMFSFIAGCPLVILKGMGLGNFAFSMTFACAGAGTIVGSLLNGGLSGRGIPSSVLLKVGLTASVCATMALLLVSLSGRDSLYWLLPLLVLNNASYGVLGPNAVHEALQPMAEVAGAASAVLRCIQMLMGAAASALVPFFFNGHSSLAMTGMMAGCSVATLAVYFLVLRPDQKRQRYAVSQVG
ncbi:multidrug effflux MFS transporter [Paraburkholderia ultramafica]|nr:multidrug effflux MFS transporter [Paraburkholderia ultramafica]